MFQFPQCPPRILCVQMRVPWHNPWRVAPFGYLRISLLATPRSFSQLATSFFGIWRLGIHRMPILPSSSVPLAQKLLLATVRFSSRQNSRLTPALFQLEPSVLSSVVNVLDRRQTPDPSTGLPNLSGSWAHSQHRRSHNPRLVPSPHASLRHTLYVHSRTDLQRQPLPLPLREWSPAHN